MINFVKETFNVQINRPVMSKRVTKRFFHCLMTISPRPVAVRILVKQRLYDSFKMRFDYLLCNAIQNGWQPPF